jgi:hypothetical protein
MLNHLQSNSNGLAKDTKFPWDDDVYLKPYLEDDPLLHSLSMDDDGDDDIYVDMTDDKLMNKEEITKQNNRPDFEKLEDHFGKLMENGVSEEESKERNLKVAEREGGEFISKHDLTTELLKTDFFLQNGVNCEPIA